MSLWQEFRNYESVKTTEKYVGEHKTDLASYGIFGVIIYILYKALFSKPRVQGSKRVTILSDDNEHSVASLT